MSSGHLIFREAKSMNELLPILRLRYSIYYNEEETTRLFLKPNSLNIDIDSYDLNARHFGLYHAFKNKENLIGCCRIIYESEMDLCDSILAFAKKQEDIFKIISKKSKYPLYLFEVNNGMAINKFYQECKRNKQSICETSRISIEKEHRDLKTFFFFIRSISSSILSDGQTNIGISSASLKKSKFYIRFLNMLPIPNSEYIVGDYQCIVLRVSRTDFSQENLELLNIMGRQLEENGEIDSKKVNLTQ